MDIFKAGEGRIKYITIKNDIKKRSAGRKVGRAFLYVYIYILAILKNRTILYKPYKRRRGKALRVYGFVMVYGLDVSQFPTVFQQEVEQGLVFHCNHKIKKEK